MSETPNEPAGSEVPAREPARRGRRIAAVAGSLLLAGAVVAGVGCTAVTVNGADRDAGAPSWKFPKAVAGTEKEPAPQGLAGMLVPYGYDNSLRGPDLGEFGSDARLSGARATALQKESLRGLPRSERKRLEREIDRQRITGMAMRSYVSGSASVYQEEDVYTVGIVLAQMDNRDAVRDLARFQTDFLDSLDIFRRGPEIKGHKDADCYLPPKDEDEALDTMFCSAHVGDVLVTVTADGVAPLDTTGVAVLLGQQLDRIAEPGKAV
ncbi:hypothetical protein ABZS79_14870 [Streptomyces griseoloalbus]|uniref:hypothetical protein n=1 Tax=Streptomyces griseoloalbus TaxID=67303 RepID=UPI0033AE7FE7